MKTDRPPSLTLNSGVQLPAVGFGVFLTPPEQTATAVATAISDGYRLVDTAAAYLNERQVGQGMVRSGVPRSELFVTTKLWVGDYGYDQARRAFDTSLAKLGLDYLDLWLLHWPVPSDFTNTIGSWQAAEQLLAEGRVRAIGVCNFTDAHLEDLTAHTEVVPAVNQVELHPFFTQVELQKANERLGIITQAWSPIGGVYGRNLGPAPDSANSPMEHPVVVDIAARHAKTPAQVLLRWHLQQGRSAIPKSVHPDRIAENFDIFDFSLSEQELGSIDALDTGQRAGSDPETFNADSYPTTIDEA
jgi:diketogulonate reductase-like aldo/keto reductase